jgi:hypothetical protein
VADTRDLAMILNARIPLIAIESADERRVLALLLRLAMEPARAFYEVAGHPGPRARRLR